MKPYIKLPTLKPLPDSNIKRRLLSDDIWISYVNHIILRYYKEVNINEIKDIIKLELGKPQANIEDKIKEHIYSWVNNDKRIGLWEFILNLEAKSDCFKGFYDLKFQHSNWDKYFVFEAKNLGKIKTTESSTLINEYVYVKTKNKEDGGMYRFMTKKYACEINFGGMLGFVVGKTKGDIIDDLIKKIKSVYNNIVNGKLNGEKVNLNSINGNKNTYTTFHLRNREIFCLYHIIMDFNI
jgi:hypothetical protein